MGAVAGSVSARHPARGRRIRPQRDSGGKGRCQGRAPTRRSSFPPHQYKTLQTLCETILPADADSGGAIEAGAPEFIDLLTSENPDYQLKLGGGLMWLDSTCADRYGNAYLDCTPQQQKEILDLIAYRKNAAQDESLSHGVEFFSLLRNLTADGFFTSKIGIKYLGYNGNTFLVGVPGMPAGTRRLIRKRRH